jgi:hypothetical protein
MDMDKQHAEEQESGGYGTPTPEQETAPRGGQQATPHEEGDASTSDAGHDGSAAVPSAEADIDGSNAEPAEPGTPFSSEPNGDATGLPEDESPKDDDGERFDAG